MELKEYKKYNEEEILQLYSEVGWTAYADDIIYDVKYKMEREKYGSFFKGS